MDYALIMNYYEFQKYIGEPIVKIRMDMFRKKFEMRLDGPVELRLKARDGEYKLDVQTNNDIKLTTMDNKAVATFKSSNGIFTKERYLEIVDFCGHKPGEIIQCSDCGHITTDVGGNTYGGMLCCNCMEQRINRNAIRQSA